MLLSKKIDLGFPFDPHVDYMFSLMTLILVHDIKGFLEKKNVKDFFEKKINLKPKDYR